jgi:Na+/H+-dicarboxylate symporter
MPGTFVRNLFLFLYLCLIVSFVWGALNHKDMKNMIKESLKTFGVFTTASIVLSFIVYFMS